MESSLAYVNLALMLATAALWKYEKFLKQGAKKLYMSARTYSDVLPSVILWNKGKVNFCINLFYLRKVLIYMASLPPRTCYIFNCWFLCFYVHLWVLLICYHILVNKAVLIRAQGQGQGRTSPHYSIVKTTLYWAFFAEQAVCIMQVLLIAATVMVGVWMGVYRYGYDWYGKPVEQFSHHPLFMFIGLVFLYGNGQLFVLKSFCIFICAICTAVLVIMPVWLLSLSVFCPLFNCAVLCLISE